VYFRVFSLNTWGGSRHFERRGGEGGTNQKYDPEILKKGEAQIKKKVF